MSNADNNIIANSCQLSIDFSGNVECISEPTLFDVGDNSNCNCNTLENLSQSSHNSVSVENENGCICSGENGNLVEAGYSNTLPDRPTVSARYKNSEGILLGYQFHPDVFATDADMPYSVCSQLHWLTAISDENGLPASSEQFGFKFLVDRFADISGGVINVIPSDPDKMYCVVTPSPKLKPMTAYYTNGFGSKLLYNVLDNGNCQVYLNIVGENLECLPQTEQLKFVWDCYQCGLHLSRVDPAVIDREKRLDIVKFNQALSVGNFRGCRNAPRLMVGDTVFESGQIWNTGFTYYIGSRNSESYGRFYETMAKHNYKAYKFEYQYNGRLANQIGLELCVLFEQLRGKPASELIREFHLFVSGLVFGRFALIDRRYARRNGSLKNCPMLAFWKDYLDYIDTEPIRIVRGDPPPSARRLGAWFDRQIICSLGDLLDGCYNFQTGRHDIKKFTDLCLMMALEGKARIARKKKLDNRTDKHYVVSRELAVKGYSALGLSFMQRSVYRANGIVRKAKPARPFSLKIDSYRASQSIDFIYDLFDELSPLFEGVDSIAHNELLTELSKLQSEVNRMASRGNVLLGDAIDAVFGNVYGNVVTDTGNPIEIAVPY